MIPYGRQNLDGADIERVVEVLRGDWLTQGPHIEEFEDALAATVGARHAVAFASGTAALHGAASAARLGSGSIVATTPLSFTASAACAVYVGARPVFVDIEPTTLNIDLEAIPTCDAAVIVHYAGLPVDLSRLQNRPPVIIEDAAHALGAHTPDGPVGNCARSDMCVFSFHPVKPITTAEGGAVTTNSPDLAEALRCFRNHGIVRKPEQGGWYYEIETLGFNYRLTDMAAALGTSQLAKLDRFTERRCELAARYRKKLAALRVEMPPSPPDGWRHSYHLFPVRVEERRRVYDEMRAAGVGVQVHFVPIYRHPLYAAGAVASDFPHTEAAYSRLLSLPMHPGLSEADQDLVVDALSKAVA